MADSWFLKIAGIDGESTDTGHKGEIDVLGWSWGLAHPDAGGGAGGGAATGKAQFADFHFVARISKASPKLFLAAAAGTHLKSAVLTGVRVSSKGTGAQYLTYTLTDVVVTSVNHQSSEPEAPTEQFSLGYGTFKVSYRPTAASGAVGPPVSGGWDLKANKKI